MVAGLADMAAIVVGEKRSVPGLRMRPASSQELPCRLGGGECRASRGDGVGSAAMARRPPALEIEAKVEVRGAPEGTRIHIHY